MMISIKKLDHNNAILDANDNSNTKKGFENYCNTSDALIIRNMDVMDNK